MTRRRTFDWVLIVVLTVAWAVPFARALDAGLRARRAGLAIAVSAARTDDSYPTVKSGRTQPPGLVPGDELLAVDGASLRGFSALHFYDLATRAAREQGFVDLSARREGADLSVRVELTPYRAWPLRLANSVAMLLSGLLLLTLAPAWYLARRAFVAAWCFAVAGAAFDPGLGPAGTFAEVTLAYFGWGFGSVLIIWNVQEFTLSARPVPRAQRILALSPGVLFAATYAVRYYLVASTVALGDLLLLGAVGSLAVLALAGLTRAYRRSGVLERRQIRWVVLGFYVALVGATLSVSISPIATAFGPPAFPLKGIAPALLSGSALAISIGILVSLVGYRWLDIDRLISATASYTIVGIAVLAGALALVPRAASAAAPVLGVDPALAQWLLTLALVGAAIPAHLALRPRLERRMFAERHRRVSGLERLVAELEGCASVEAIWRLASERIDALLEPTSLVVYARAEDGAFAPRFAHGREAPQSYASDSLLVRVLERRGRPLVADAGELDPFDRAAFETLGVALIVPIRSDDTLLAFACLGGKRSGDIYTPEETLRLAAVAARCGELARPPEGARGARVQVFRREGELWTISSHGKQIHLRDMRGLNYLAVLLREPGREFAAIELVHAASGPATSASAPVAELRIARRLGDAGPVLDLQARAEYRARVAALEEELEDAERCADLGRLERASAEREALLAELESTSRGARPGSDAERARVAVTKAIKAALEKIAEAHPELGAHLAATIRRGYTCAYEPDPRALVEWEV